MPKRVERDLSRIGWLDYVLMCFGSCLAVYSAGMSIQQPPISYFCITLIVLGTIVSYTIRVLTLKSMWIKFDGVFYSVAVIAAIFESTLLRGMMPEGGFPREIAAAGWLSWMLILGSFATWQDSTLLFQAIPALALFGLVGCYDTYRDVTYSFFAFLMCLATLFARAHGREMLRKAAESGYFTRGLAPGSPIPSVETTPGLALTLKRGPWRWVAGPEWALASALVVVLFSLAGAPVIRQTVSGVAGFVSLAQPPVRLKPQTFTAGGNDISGQSVTIGKKYTHFFGQKELYAQLDQPRYLRTDIYDRYTGHGWQNTMGAETSTQPGSPLSTYGMPHIADFKTVPFDIKTLHPSRLLPLPVDTANVRSPDAAVELTTDGTWITATVSSTGIELSGVVDIPASGTKPESSPKEAEWAKFVDQTNVSGRVHDLAVHVAGSDGSDYVKALRLQHEISSRIVYNLDADETPSDRDPVDYSLFDLKQGYCTSFASSMVLMARAVGIPARYVQGYLPDEAERQAGGRYAVEDKDFHAWAELYFDNFGWVVFDPSIGADSVPGFGVGETGNAKPWYQRGIMQAVVGILGVLVAVVAIVGGSSFLKSYRGHLSPRSDLDKVYIQYSKRLEKVLGKRRMVGQTATEFLESVRPALGRSYSLAQDLNERFIVAMYGPDAVGRETVTQFRADVRRFKRTVGEDLRNHRLGGP